MPDPRTEEIRVFAAGYIGMYDGQISPAWATAALHHLEYLLRRIEALNASNQAIARTAVQHRESAHRRAERLGAALKENRDLRKALRDPNEIARQ